MPKWQDEIDIAVAKFINMAEDKYDIIPLVKREQAGFYVINNKKMSLILGTNDQVLVRVGGGYLSLRQILDESLLQKMQPWNQAR